MKHMVHLEPLVRAAIAEDVGSGDVTTELFVPADALGRATITAKAKGVVAGIDVAKLVFLLAAESELRGGVTKRDGDVVEPGDSVMIMEGRARDLLVAERTALNFLMRLSGIATLTAKFVAAVEGAGASILDTRKTTPGWRELEKAAVVAGGGVNHRFGLDDAVLAKENHLAFGRDWADALAHRPAGMQAIVEAEDLDDFRRAVAAGADIVMLDEFSLDDVRTARAERGNVLRPLLEVSGGVTLDTVRDYAEAGADRISIGALTHSAPSLDLSMRVSPRPS